MAKPITRRRVLGGMAAGTTVALAAPYVLRIPRARAAGPIRLGLVTALSGNAETFGRQHVDGAEIAAEQLNARGGIMGRPVEIVARDAKAKPATGATVTRELAGEGVNMVLGTVSSAVALAISSILQDTGSILMTTAAHSDKLTNDEFTPNFFRITDNPYMRQRAQAKLCAERYPEITTWGGVIPDHAYGRSSWNCFVDGLLEYYPAVAGKEVTIKDPVLTKYGASDYKNYIVQTMSLGVEGLFYSIYAADAITFHKQAEPYGLHQQIQVFADSGNEYLLPQALGSNTPENVWIGTHYYHGGYMDNPVNQAFYKAYVARTGNEWPMGFPGEAHAAVLAYAAAIEKAGSTETADVIAALEGLSLNTDKGMRTLRKEDHQAICDVNIYSFKPADNERGWDVAEFVKIDGATVIDAPTPGKPMQFKHLKNPI